MKKAISCRNWPERWLHKQHRQLSALLPVTGDGSYFEPLAMGRFGFDQRYCTGRLGFIVGSNTPEESPGAGDSGKARAQAARSKINSLDLRENEMARRADVFLHHAGTDLIWLSRSTVI